MSSPSTPMTAALAASEAQRLGMKLGLSSCPPSLSQTLPRPPLYLQYNRGAVALTSICSMGLMLDMAQMSSFYHRYFEINLPPLLPPHLINTALTFPSLLQFSVSCLHSVSASFSMVTVVTCTVEQSLRGFLVEQCLTPVQAAAVSHTIHLFPARWCESASGSIRKH